MTESGRVGLGLRVLFANGSQVFKASTRRSLIRTHKKTAPLIVSRADPGAVLRGHSTWVRRLANRSKMPWNLPAMKSRVPVALSQRTSKVQQSVFLKYLSDKKHLRDICGVKSNSREDNSLPTNWVESSLITHRALTSL